MINVNSKVEVLMSTGVRKRGTVVQFLGSNYYAVQPDDDTEQIYTSEAFITVLEAAASPTPEQQAVVAREEHEAVPTHTGAYGITVRDLDVIDGDGYKQVELIDCGGLVCDHCGDRMHIGDHIWTQVDEEDNVYCNSCHDNDELPLQSGDDEEDDDDVEDDPTVFEPLDVEPDALGRRHVRITHLSEDEYTWCDRCADDIAEGQELWYDPDKDEYYCEDCERILLEEARQRNGGSDAPQPVPEPDPQLPSGLENIPVRPRDEAHETNSHEEEPGRLRTNAPGLNSEPGDPVRAEASGVSPAGIADMSGPISAVDTQESSALRQSFSVDVRRFHWNAHYHGITVKVIAVSKFPSGDVAAVIELPETHEINVVRLDELVGDL